MDDNQNSRDQLPSQPSAPRSFKYRATVPDSSGEHPLRRATDMPAPFCGVAGELSPSAQLLKFRVYMKLN